MTIKAGTTVYITKYALTEGVIETKAISDESQINYITVEKYGEFSHWRVGLYLFTDYAEALAKAERMRVTKIRSVKRQLDKLENLKF